MAFIDLVEWSPQDDRIFAHKDKRTNLSTFTQLLVRESQEAVLFSKGQIIGKFGPGKHTLSTENLPVLRRLYGLPFGGKNPFFAEIWYVNKTAPLTIDWRTNAMRYVDPDYQAAIPMVASGRYGLKVVWPERFLVELVGAKTDYTADELTNHFSGKINSKVKSSIMNFMKSYGIGINMISSSLDELSEYLKQPFSEFWDGYGFQLAGFDVTEVTVDTSTPEGREIEKAIGQRSAQAIAGYSWQQQQMFNTANNSANNGSGMGILGVGMLMGAFGGNNGNSGVGNAMMSPQFNQGQGMMGQNNMQQGGFNQGGFNQGQNGFNQNGFNQNGFNQGQNGFNQNGFNQNGFNQGGMNGGNMGKQVFCSNCSKKFSSTQSFCPYCGHKYNPCPTCGADNSEKATRCTLCGTFLKKLDFGSTGSVCPRCHQPVSPGEAFCSNCGQKL